jgi:hypothetical protein
MSHWRLNVSLTWFSLALLFLTKPVAAQVTYTIDREFPDLAATLTGTVQIPEGSFTIMNQGPSPFTSVDLTLTVNGTSYALTTAFTGAIRGTGEFLINATSTTLTFDALNADGSNPADLQFFPGNVFSMNRYVIGHDGSPGGFETISSATGGGTVMTTLPAVFGITSVPEPPTCLGVCLALGLFALLRRKIRVSGFRLLVGEARELNPAVRPISTMQR